MSLDETLSVVGPIAGAYFAYRLLRPKRGRKARRADKATANPTALDAPVRVAGMPPKFTYRLLDTGWFITGPTGSGKTSFLKLAVDRFARDGCGIYLPAARPQDAHQWCERFDKIGRKDVYLVDHSARWCVNAYAAMRKPGLTGRDQARRLTFLQNTLAEVITRQAAGGGDDAQFWASNRDALLTAAFEMHEVAGVPPTMAGLDAVLASYPQSPEAVTTDAFKRGECGRLLRLAFERAEADPALRPAFDRVGTFFTQTFAGMAEKTRSGVLANVQGPLAAMLGGVTESVLGAERPTLDIPRVIRDGGIVVTAFNYAEDKDTGTAINAALKLLYQQELLTRVGGDELRPTILALDEYPLIATSFDAQYAALQRASRGPMACIAQGLESLYAEFPGDKGKHQVGVLTGNLGLKAVVGGATPTTASWVCNELLGQEERAMWGGSSQGAEFDPASLMWGGGGGGGQASGSFSRQHVPRLLPADLQRLRTGGPGNRGKIDVLLIAQGLDPQVVTVTQEDFR